MPGTLLLRVAIVVLVAVPHLGEVRAETPPLSAERIVADRERARARQMAERATVKELVNRRLEAARALVAFRTEEVRAGRGSLPALRQAEALLRRALRPPTATALPRADLEEEWTAAWSVHAAIQARYQAGMVSAAEHQEALIRLLDVEIELALGRAKKKP